MKWQQIKIILIGIVIYSCSNNEGIDNHIERYYQVYREHKDYKQFISFYSDDIILEDIISGDKIMGKKQLKRFFDWDNTNYQSLASKHLIINDMIIEKNQGVIKGYFSKFKWNKIEVEAMHFTTILTFNENGKIIKQVDWINYPNTLVDYFNRTNSNTWISQ